MIYCLRISLYNGVGWWLLRQRIRAAKDRATRNPDNGTSGRFNMRSATPKVPRARPTEAPSLQPEPLFWRNTWGLSMAVWREIPLMGHLHPHRFSKRSALPIALMNLLQYYLKEFGGKLRWTPAHPEKRNSMSANCSRYDCLNHVAQRSCQRPSRLWHRQQVWVRPDSNGGCHEQPSIIAQLEAEYKGCYNSYTGWPSAANRQLEIGHISWKRDRFRAALTIPRLSRWRTQNRLWKLKCTICTNFQYYRHFIVPNWSGVSTGTWATRQKLPKQQKNTKRNHCSLCRKADPPATLDQGMPSKTAPSDMETIYTNGSKRPKRIRNDNHHKTVRWMEIAVDIAVTYSKGAHVWVGMLTPTLKRLLKTRFENSNSNSTYTNALANMS